jgi:glycosyltransferase involved in cell wall biosynthesis
MRREPWAVLVPHPVLHVVGRVTDEVASFLGPATHALARTGREQTVVMIDELQHRHNVSALHSSVNLVMARSERNPIRQWRALREACCDAFGTTPVQAVHLHGFFCGVVGAAALRRRAVAHPLIFSPHASRTLSRVGRLALLLGRPWLRPSRSAAIVNTPQELRAFDGWKVSGLVESPIAEAIFALPRREARHPLIVTGGRSHNARSAQRLAQLAVLLGGADMRLAFNWFGCVDDASRLRLQAAGVGVFEVENEAECAWRFSAGWIYLAPAGTRGFPLFPAIAMAAGLPCVAFDCPQHRELIRDAHNGYLCKTEREMTERIAALIDRPALRREVGERARAEARQRFGEAGFAQKLLAAYDDEPSVEATESTF